MREYEDNPQGKHTNHLELLEEEQYQKEGSVHIKKKNLRDTEISD